MSFEALLTQTVTVVRLSDVAWDADSEGNPTPTAPAQEMSYPGLIQQQATNEVQIGPDTFLTDHRLFLDADAEISGFDQVLEGARVFEVIGDPALERTPRGAHHIEAQLRQITTEGNPSGS